MFILLRGKKGQGIFQQYTLIFAIALGAVFAMKMYFQRGIQARFFDARHYMYSLANQVYSNASYNLQGELLGTYEPYYKEDRTAKVIDATTVRSIFGTGAGTSGIFRIEHDSTTEVSMTKNEGLVNQAY